MCYCTAERSVPQLLIASHIHLLNLKKPPKHAKPLIIIRKQSPQAASTEAMQWPGLSVVNCILASLCNPRWGFSYAWKKWHTAKDATVQIITEIVNNTITCTRSVWAQLFHSWEMHLCKVKISHKPVFLPKAFFLSVLSSLIYLLTEEDLAQHKPAMKWKTATALEKALLRQRTRVMVVRADCRQPKESRPTGGPGTVY